MDGVDRFAARHLASGMAAHAVSHHPQAELVVAQKGVFVDLSLLADVGRPTRVKFEPVSVHALVSLAGMTWVGVAPLRRTPLTTRG